MGVNPARLALPLLTLGARACDDAPDTPICDGSERVRLAVSTGGGGVPSFVLASEVGYDFLYVDGHCHYALNSGEWLEPTRVGVLDAERAAVLSSRLDYRHWPDLAGDYERAVFDASTRVFDSGRLDHAEISCTVCEGLSEDIDRVVSGSREQLSALASGSFEASGPVRFVVWAADATSSPPVDAASSPVDFAVLATPPGTPTPTVHVSETEAQAASLRALRSATRADPVAQNTRAPDVNVRDAVGRVFRIRMRDVLPMEGADHAVDPR